MTTKDESVPDASRFGEAGLADCEREQIHLPGSIQPHGALLALNESQLEISHASVNSAEFLGFDSSDSLLGWKLDALGKALVTSVRQLLANHTLKIPRVVTLQLDGNHSALFDCVVHRSATGQVILEFEQVCETDRALSMQLKSGVDAISAAASYQSLCDVSAQLLKQVLGYCRVMVYRFDPDGHGQVFAEQCDTHLEPYLGNHYPASDIPQIARDLYLRNRVRMLVDVDYEPVPIGPSGDVDMSMCHLRSMSPIHLQYLKNMGVASSLVTSLTIGGSLWGLIACHDAKPRGAGYPTRAAAELVSEVVAMRISALQSVTQTRIEHSIRRLDQSMIEVLAHDGDWAKALFDNAQGLLQVLDATGAALTHDDEITSIGSVPDRGQLRQLTEWLDENAAGQLLHTNQVAAEDSQLRSVNEVTPGVLAVPVSNVGGEYLICFRPETVRTVVWGGDPRKAVETGAAPAEISPRSSFAQWRELLKETAIPWTQTEISAAELVGSSVRDILHQIRAVRALIAHNQLGTLIKQLERSNIPGLIANPDGEIILANEALATLVWQDSPPTTHLNQIARYFEESSLASHNISELVSRQRTWRGAATIDSRPVLVRADPVPSPEGGVLGYIVLLTDVSSTLGTANRPHRILEGLLESYSSTAADIPEPLRVEFDNLAKAVLENARMAAMEISDGIDVARVTTMLDGIEDSVARTTRLIEALATHSAPAAH